MIWLRFHHTVFYLHGVRVPAFPSKNKQQFPDTVYAHDIATWWRELPVYYLKLNILYWKAYCNDAHTREAL